MTTAISPERIAHCYTVARSALLDERNSAGHWVGELSTSALSTATAVMALELVRRGDVERGGSSNDPSSGPSSGPDANDAPDDGSGLIAGGLAWLAGHQNPDGGWGDTVKSHSNISTTMLAHAAFHAANRIEQYAKPVASAAAYIERVGGVHAVLRRYGKDRTFSVPILTHCALAGLADWRDVIPLPFELACVPAGLYKAIRLPVVSYALPALIAIGQVRFHFLKPANPVTRLLRNLTTGRSLRLLQSIQPTNGGFLEAAPLTSFVTMSLAAMGLTDHPVTRRGVAFLRQSVRPDGSWPIDTNLATWLTTLAVNALQDDFPVEGRPAVRDWLLKQQYRHVHPYTQADPGGWAWTDQPGGVPDADDTPGAILALLALRDNGSDAGIPAEEKQALACGAEWLLGLQNRDGGWPTFCRGWGTQPFDRSAPDITAHVLKAFFAWRESAVSTSAPRRLRRRVSSAMRRGFHFLDRAQRPDGTWFPLWFGNQDAPDEQNSTYGTARVLAAYRDVGLFDCLPVRRGRQALLDLQNEDGGWGGGRDIPSSVEETALAVEAMLSEPVGTGGRNRMESQGQLACEFSALAGKDGLTGPTSEALQHGLAWLMDRVEDGSFRQCSPIGFYFAKLWYFEMLYPLLFTVAALGRAQRVTQPAL